MFLSCDRQRAMESCFHSSPAPSLSLTHTWGRGDQSQWNITWCSAGALTQLQHVSTGGAINTQQSQISFSLKTDMCWWYLISVSQVTSSGPVKPLQHQAAWAEFCSGVVEFVRCDISCFQGVLGLRVALKCQSLCGRDFFCFVWGLTETLSQTHRRHSLTETRRVVIRVSCLFWMRLNQESDEERLLIISTVESRDHVTHALMKSFRLELAHYSQRLAESGFLCE